MLIWTSLLAIRATLRFAKPFTLNNKKCKKCSKTINGSYSRTNCQKNHLYSEKPEKLGKLNFLKRAK
jgi:hypothetical protein